MTTLYKYIVLLILTLLVGCGREKVADNAPKLPFYPPIHVRLDPSSGHSINVLTGDSIQTEIKISDNSIQLGNAFPAVGLDVDPDSVLPPTVQKRPSPIQTVMENLPGSYPRVIPINIPVKNLRPKKLKPPLAVHIQPRIIPAQPGLTEPAGKMRIKNSSLRDIQILDVDEGLSSSYIRASCMDSRGFMWIGTDGGGIMRYDGQNLLKFQKGNGLINGSIRDLICDKKGNIWMATFGGGVCKYDGLNFYHYTEKEGLISNNVRSICEDHLGNIWIGTNDKGLCKLAGNNLYSYSTENGLPGNAIFSLCPSKSGVWMGMFNDGLARLDGDELTVFNTENAMPSMDIIVVKSDHSGSIWCGTNGSGAFQFQKDQFIYYDQNSGIPGGIISDVWVGKDQTVWLATYGQGLCKIKDGTCEIFSESTGLSNDRLHDLVEDPSGNIWAGTDGAGMNRICPNSFRHFNKSSGLPSSSVWSLFADSDSSVWMGTFGGGVCHLKKNIIETWGEDQGLKFPSVRAILKDNKGRMWFGTFGGGIYVFDGKNIFNYTVNQGLPSDNIRALLEDKMGNIWIGTWDGGLAMYDGKKFRQYNTDNGLMSNNIRSLVLDKNNDLWIAAYGGGLTKYRDGFFTNYTDANGLSSNDILNLYCDSKNRLWICTNMGGVMLKVEDDLFIFSEKSGLPSDLIWSVFEDHEGDIWIGSEKGLSKLKIKSIGNKNNIDYEIVNFSKTSGLKALDFYQNSVCEDRNHRLWWGTGSTLSMLDISVKSDTLKTYLPRITELSINEKQVSISAAANQTFKNLRYSTVLPFGRVPGDVIVPYYYNHFTIGYTFMNWSAPGTMKYSHRMIGSDNQWSIPTIESKADYRNLSYGKHKLLIQSLSTDSKWSQQAEYAFEILPPWWLTFWAKLMYIIMLLLSMILIVWWRTKSIHRRQKELETEVTRATKEIVEQKEEIEKEKERSEELLLNILPSEVAEELKKQGFAEAKQFDQVTVMFTDFKDFTKISENLTARNLVAELDEFFTKFDTIISKYGIEKIKTIGDSYMCVAGLPTENPKHAKEMILAALEIQKYMNETQLNRSALGKPQFEIRMGIHSGSVVAGIVGLKKFAYDIWGDTVNMASRMESSGEVNQINISKFTYELVKDDFDCEYRGEIPAKNLGNVAMYFVKEKEV